MAYLDIHNAEVLLKTVGFELNYRYQTLGMPPNESVANFRG